MKYLKGSMNIGVTIDPKNDGIDIYSDTNHGDISLDDQKSISRGASFAIACGNVFAIGSMSSKSVGECYGEHTCKYSGHLLMSEQSECQQTSARLCADGSQ